MEKEKVDKKTEQGLDLRRLLGQFATGVTIITIEQSGQVYGMTVNSFTSVSLDPALILWCLARGGSHQASFALFSKAERFCVSVLNEKQGDLARHFAHHDRHDLSPDYLISDSLYMKDALVGFDCTVSDHLSTGDHVIILGKVEEAQLLAQDNKPLIFYHSDYRELK